MQEPRVDDNGHVHEFSEQEARDLFDARARYYLNISGEEFLRRWRNGDYVGKTDEFGVATLAMLLPLVDEDSRSVG